MRSAVLTVVFDGTERDLELPVDLPLERLIPLVGQALAAEGTTFRSIGQCRFLLQVSDQTGLTPIAEALTLADYDAWDGAYLVVEQDRSSERGSSDDSASAAGSTVAIRLAVYKAQDLERRGRFDDALSAYEKARRLAVQSHSEWAAVLGRAVESLGARSSLQASLTPAEEPARGRWRRLIVLLLAVAIAAPLVFLGVLVHRRLRQASLAEMRDAHRALVEKDSRLEQSPRVWTPGDQKDRSHAWLQFLDRFRDDDPASSEDDDLRKNGSARLEKWKALVFVADDAGFRDALRSIGPGRTIHLAKGDYSLGEALTLERGVVLQGADRDTTTIRARFRPAGSHVIRASGGALALSDLSLRYEGDSPANLIEAENAEIRLRSCRIEGARYKPPAGGGAGLWAKKGTSGQVVDCEFLDNQLYGIYLTGDAKLAIERNRLVGSKEGAAIHFGGDASGLIRENQAIQNLYGISVSDSAHPNLVGNRLSRNRGPEGEGAGIVFAKDAAGTADGNVCEDNDYGIFILRPARPTVADNRCLCKSERGACP